MITFFLAGIVDVVIIIAFFLGFQIGDTFASMCKPKPEFNHEKTSSSFTTRESVAVAVAVAYG